MRGREATVARSAVTREGTRGCGKSERPTDRPPEKGGEGEGVSEGDRAVFSLGLAATSGTNVSARSSDGDRVGECPRRRGETRSTTERDGRTRERMKNRAGQTRRKKARRRRNESERKTASRSNGARQREREENQRRKGVGERETRGAREKEKGTATARRRGTARAGEERRRTERNGEKRRAGRRELEREANRERGAHASHRPRRVASRHSKLGPWERGGSRGGSSQFSTAFLCGNRCERGLSPDHAGLNGSPTENRPSSPPIRTTPLHGGAKPPQQGPSRACCVRVACAHPPPRVSATLSPDLATSAFPQDRLVFRVRITT